MAIINEYLSLSQPSAKYATSAKSTKFLNTKKAEPMNIPQELGEVYAENMC